MPKTLDEIRELLGSELFRKGVTKRFIVINDELTQITYNCKNQTKRRLNNPEEFVQATAYLKLIFDYGYLPQNIAVNYTIQMGSDKKEVDILVYNEENNKVLIVVECKEDGINERQFQIAVEQAFSYAHARAAEYVWVTSGIKDEYFQIAEAFPLVQTPVSDIPKRGGTIQRHKYVKGEHDPVKGTQGDLLQRFKSAHNALWGGGALAPNTAFDELDKLIFCKIWDEKWKDNCPQSKGQPYQFQIIYYPNDRNNEMAKIELEKRIIELYNEGKRKDPEVFKEEIKLDKHKIFSVVKLLHRIIQILFINHNLL